MNIRSLVSAFSFVAYVFIIPLLFFILASLLKLWQPKMINDSCWFFFNPLNLVNLNPCFSLQSAYTRSIVSFLNGYISFRSNVCLISFASSMYSSHTCLVITFWWFLLWNSFLAVRDTLATSFQSFCIGMYRMVKISLRGTIALTILLV